MSLLFSPPRTYDDATLIEIGKVAERAVLRFSADAEVLEKLRG